MDPELNPEEEIDVTDDLDMSDDDLAAALGYVTTLSEQMLPQDTPVEALDEEMEGEEEETEVMSDEEQTAEIEAIRAELEALKEDYEQEPTETGTTL